MRTLLCGLLLLPAALAAQDQERVLFYPKPIARADYRPPMKPVTRLADLRARHQGKPSWREPIIDDGNSVSFMVQEPPGTRHERRLHPDSAAWFVILEGRVRFEIERTDRTFEIVDATKGSFVFVPERMLHGFEVMGEAPAIRYEVTTGPSSTPVFEKPPSTAAAGVHYIPVTLSTGPNPLDVRNHGLDGRPWPHHYNVYELAQRHAGEKSFTQEAMRANRARGNFICGYRPATQPTDSGNRGHLHADTAESWIVMLGELRWVFDGDVQNAIVARQGDIVYAVPGTFHSPQFWGADGLNCRLTNSTMPSLNHVYDAPSPR
jgi:mannose-6-phosphate isomerase-like protein (cupin superfamily)